MQNNQNTVLSIQYLRGMAALAVALSHIAGHPGLSLETGAAGVDVFFVISGFVIWTVTSRRPVKPGRFMIDRLTRIAPPYVLLTVIVYLLATYIPGAFPHMRTSLSHVILSVLFIPHIDPSGTAFPQVVPGWTLNYELFFYLVFACGLSMPQHTRIWMYTCLLSMLTLIGLLTHSDYAIVNACTNPQLMEFVAGLWLGMARSANRLPHGAWGWAALLAGAAGFVSWELLQGIQPTHWRALVWGLPSALIVGGLLTIERRAGIVQSQLALLLGNASFSIYLVNVFVVAATWRLVGPVSVPGYFASAVMTSVVGGVVYWKIVEQPITRLARHWFHRPAPMVSAA